MFFILKLWHSTSTPAEFPNQPVTYLYLEVNFLGVAAMSLLGRIVSQSHWDPEEPCDDNG